MTLVRLDLGRAERLSSPSALRFGFPLPAEGQAPGQPAAWPRRGAAEDGFPLGRTPRGEGPEPPRGEPSAFLSLRAEGDMRFLPGGANPNRERFFAALGLDPELVLGLELSHSRGVAFPLEEALPGAAGREAGEGGEGGGRDGIVLRDPSFAASITVADCMPIWLLDRASGAFGVLHSGWRGTGILESALSALKARYGSDPASVSVILGPAIGPCCYDVPEGRALGFAREFGAEAAPFAGDRYRLDLRAANVALAQRLGVGALLSVEACTSCEDSLGSFRREGPEAFTRMVALAARVPRLAAGDGPG